MTMMPIPVVYRDGLMRIKWGTAEAVPNEKEWCERTPAGLVQSGQLHAEFTQPGAGGVVVGLRIRA